jgi:hypothetical protein
MIMAHFWIERDDPPRWELCPLGDSGHIALAALLEGGSSVGGDDLTAPGVSRYREIAALTDAWILFAEPAAGVRVNGLPMQTGLRLLDDRDEIGLPHSPTLFFSTEMLARLEPMPSSDRSKSCPRCKRPIVVNAPAVRCPNSRCGLWYHQDDEYPCWLYHDRCAVCPQETSLDAGYRWTPEGL